MCSVSYTKKVQGKNQVTRNLSSYVVEKFDGYEMVGCQIACKEMIELTAINIVYELIFDEKIPVPCFFTDQIFLAYRSYIGRFDKGKERISNRIVKQYHYCEKLFAKNDEVMKEHLRICKEREGITYSFDNGQIITFQDNLEYLGDAPFTVYFDFETTTGDSVFFIQKYSL